MKCFSMKYELSPQIVITDFQKAIQNAVILARPNTELQGCRFHLTQAWYRKIQEIGLSKSTAIRKAKSENSSEC